MNRRDLLEVLAASAAVGLTGAVPLGRFAAPKVDAGLVADCEQGIDALADAYLKGIRA